MKVLIILPLAGMILFAGCGKSETPETVTSPTAVPSEEYTAENANQSPTEPQAGLSSAFDAVAADISAKNYEAAAGKLALLQHTPKTPDEERQFVQLTGDLNALLLELSQSDPKAKEAYQNYGRMMLGR